MARSAKADESPSPYALMLTAGNVSEVKTAPAPLECAGPIRYLLADIRAPLRPAANAP
jgi:hypothetical protein